MAFNNVVLDLASLDELEHTPDLFITHAADYDYDPDAGDPVEWLRFLDQLWPGDPESISVLGEWFGYSLGSETRLHKALMMVGPKRGGKGTIGRVLTAIVGKHNVSGPSLKDLCGTFGLQGLVDKPLAIIPDARLSNRSDVASMIERLLSITGEDLTDVHRKFLPPLVGVRLPTRFVLISNEMPMLMDASGAIASRFLVLVLSESFEGREDHSLTDRLLDERAGILNWALDHRERLMTRGRFVLPEKSEKAIQDLEDLCSPMRAFLRDKCVVGPTLYVPTADLLQAWKDWCNDQGRKWGNNARFGRDLTAAVPGLTRKQRRISGVLTWCYGGVELQ